MQVGPYELKGELARGGMGVVYRAWDPAAGREVALKLMLARQSGPHVTRFRREALALGRLDHPGIVRIHAAGEHEGAPWIVMDLIDGESLQRRLERVGPFSPADAVRLTLALADAVGHAHAHGVLHRDLKPDNVLLRGEEPLLTDFGLARHLDSDSTRVSVPGRMLGTPGYWSPEQVKGEVEQFGPTTDVYGLGATLYALLTGEAPQRASNLHEAMAQALRPPRAPSALRPEVDRALDAVVLRCLEPDPTRRYPDVGSLAEDLRRWQTGAPTQAGRARRGATARRLALLLALCGVALALLSTRAAPVASTSASPAPQASPSVVRVASAPSGPPTDELEGALLRRDDDPRRLDTLERWLRAHPADPRRARVLQAWRRSRFLIPLARLERTLPTPGRRPAFVVVGEEEVLLLHGRPELWRLSPEAAEQAGPVPVPRGYQLVDAVRDGAGGLDLALDREGDEAPDGVHGWVVRGRRPTELLGERALEPQPGRDMTLPVGPDRLARAPLEGHTVRYAVSGQMAEAPIVWAGDRRGVGTVSLRLASDQPGFAVDLWLSPDGRWLGLANRAAEDALERTPSELRVYDLDDVALKAARGAVAGLTCLTGLPGGAVAVGDASHGVTFWPPEDVPGLEPVLLRGPAGLSSHEQPVRDLCVPGPGHLLLTVASDLHGDAGELRLWDTAARPPALLEDFGPPLAGSWFWAQPTPSGRRLVLGGRGGLELRAWPWPDGEP